MGKKTVANGSGNRGEFRVRMWRRKKGAWAEWAEWGFDEKKKGKDGRGEKREEGKKMDHNRTRTDLVVERRLEWQRETGERALKFSFHLSFLLPVHPLYLPQAHRRPQVFWHSRHPEAHFISYS